MIDHELRSKGIGASEVAALLGLDPRRDAFSIWARKLNLIDEPESNIRMRKGRYFEQGIVRWFSDETELSTEWWDQTMQHPTRTWQVATPDAFILERQEVEGGGSAMRRIAGVDAKLIAHDQRDHWGDSGTVNVPDHYAIQCQWTCSALDYPYWDIAAAIGDELRVYRIHRDADIEAVLLETVERFWTENIIGRTQPPIGATQAAKDYIKKRFPKNVQPLRVATPEEVDLMIVYKDARERWDRMEKEYDPIENRIKMAIGEAEGLIHGPWRITFKKDADSMGTDWRAVAHELGQHLELVRSAHEYAQKIQDGSQFFETISALPKAIADVEKAHQIITRHGPRKLLPKFGKGK